LWPLIPFQQYGGPLAKDMGMITDECEAEKATKFMKTNEADTQGNYDSGHNYTKASR
jgi:hypothetical protein